MDWFPLYNALRIAAISTAAVFFLGIWAAYYIAKLPRLVKGVLDVVLTLPLVLPPTVVGWLLLMLLGPKRPLGAWVLEAFGVKLVMTWWSAIFATIVVAFPLMYRTARALGEYGATSMIAGYTPGRTATISTTVYQLWRTNDDAGAARWVLVNVAISAVFLLAVNLLETRQRQTRKEVR